MHDGAIFAHHEGRSNRNLFLPIVDAVCARDFAVGIRKQWIVDAAEFFGPFEVALDAVTADAEHGASRFLEGFQCLVESGDLGRADEGEVARIKEDRDEIGAEIAQTNRRGAALDGAGEFEIGRGVARS